MSRLIAITLAFVLGATAAAADECTTAQSMVEKAVAHYKEVGKQKAYADFMNKDDKTWIDGELYVIVAAADGTFKAHAINPKLIDNPAVMDLKDVNGVVIVREMVASGREHPDGGWVKYTWTHPVTKKLAPKQTWVKAFDGQLFMVGCYP